MTDLSFDVFISYRRSDGARAARWLRRELEAFRPPRSLRNRYRRRIKVYLDTAYERGTSDFYEQSIKPALLGSHFLVVVATPNAIRRSADTEDWIAREVSDFAAGPRGANVIAARAAGEFDDPLPADLSRRFPNIEIVDLRGAGRFSRLNPTRAARLSSEKLKLVAPLLDIAPEEMPKLRQEEEKRQQTRLGAAIGAVLGVAIAISGLSVYALHSRNSAARALEDSMFATGSMVLLATGLTKGPSGDSDARLRRILVNQGCDLLDKLAVGTGREPSITELVTCRLERGRSRETLKEPDKAEAEFKEAIALAADRHARESRVDAATAWIQARQAYAEYLARSGEPERAEAEYNLLLGDAHRLGGMHKSRDEFPRAEAEALGRLGDLLSKRSEPASAVENYRNAAAALGRLLTGPDAKADVEIVSWLARLHLLSGEQLMQAHDTEQALQEFGASVATAERVRQGQRTPAFDHQTALAYAMLAALQRQRGDGSAAEVSQSAASACLERVLNAPSASTDLKHKAGSLKSWLEGQAAATGSR